MSLKKIIKEIERTGDYYKRSSFYEVRQAYDDYIQVMVLDAPKSEQYELLDYWDGLKDE